MSNWEGVKGATEHRTTGTRAWCHQDQTWCYPHALCQCCYHASEEFEVCPTCEGEGYVPKDIHEIKRKEMEWIFEQFVK